MPMQDFMPFLQDLLLKYYQFTLENGQYALVLAACVWLPIALFYSIRISILHRRQRLEQQARQEAQSQLAAAELQISTTQETLAAANEQISQEVTRTAQIKQRLNDLAGQISEHILALAAQPDLGQQGLSVKPGLDAEALWQRYSIAVKHLSEDLLVAKAGLAKSSEELSAANTKLAEKELQLQASQMRLDNQLQKAQTLELAVEAQKTEFLGRIAEIETRLAESEAKRQVAEAHPLSASPTEPAAPQFVAPTPVSLETEKPVVIEAVAVEPVLAASAPVTPVAAVETAPILNQDYTAPTPAPVVAEPVSAAPPVSGNKFKSLFAGAMHKIEKLDAKLGKRGHEPELPDVDFLPSREPQVQPAAVVVEPAPVSIAAPALETAVVADPAPAAAHAAAAGLGGRFKSLFGQNKAAEPVSVSPEPVILEAAPAPVLEAPQVATANAVESSSRPVLGDRFKSLFGGAKPAPIAQPAPISAETTSKPEAPLLERAQAELAQVERTHTVPLEAAPVPDKRSATGGSAASGLFGNLKQHVQKIDHFFSDTPAAPVLPETEPAAIETTPSAEIQPEPLAPAPTAAPEPANPQDTFSGISGRFKNLLSGGR